MKELDIAQLMVVCTESNCRSGKEVYPEFSENERVIQAEQDFYAGLSAFFADPDAFYAVWLCDGCYASALRIERYRDGYLMAGLETAPGMRRKGNAGKLINAVIDYLSSQGSLRLYSHVDKKNIASIGVHNACGFKRILEHAVFLDGSVLNTSCTFCFTL